MSGILEFLSGQDLLAVADIRAVLEREIDDAGPASLVALRDRLTLDAGWSYYPPDPLAQRIHLLLATRFIQPESRVTGLEHLNVVAGEPVIILSNHVSYADANVLHMMLHRVGCDDLAGRLTAMAGPKVFTNRERRFSSLCFGTIKVPQSRDVSSEEAVQDARDVARSARRAIEIAADRVASGDALVLFGEGTRSRSAQMQRMLAAWRGISRCPARGSGSRRRVAAIPRWVSWQMAVQPGRRRSVRRAPSRIAGGARAAAGVPVLWVPPIYLNPVGGPPPPASYHPARNRVARRTAR